MRNKKKGATKERKKEASMLTRQEGQLWAAAPNTEVVQVTREGGLDFRNKPLP